MAGHSRCEDHSGHNCGNHVAFVCNGLQWGDVYWMSIHVCLVAEVSEGHSASSKGHNHYWQWPYQYFCSRHHAICQNNGETDHTAVHIFIRFTVNCIVWITSAQWNIDSWAVLLLWFSFSSWIFATWHIVTHTANFQCVKSYAYGWRTGWKFSTQGPSLVCQICMRVRND